MNGIDPTQLWRGRLVLEDGTIWRGRPFGAEGEAQGEVVFNTAMCGYQEVLTDPSYTGQVVCMTAPLIGNYGINAEDGENDGPRVAGFLVREVAGLHSNFRARESLPAWLKRHGVVALSGLDTRALTRRLRAKGAMRMFMTTESMSDTELLRRLESVPDLVGRDLATGVSCGSGHSWTRGFETVFAPSLAAPEGGEPPLVVAYDFGAKESIFRSLRAVGCDVRVVPASTTAEEVLALDPDGVFLSNGPGDPRPLAGPTEAVRRLLGKLPIFGICLGHQILGQAIGAEVVKLKFGHHGSNHPVKDLESGRVEITSQNHGFAVTPESLARVGARLSHVNLNDGTVEGMVLPDRRAFSVQYHPEASPGPHDSLYLFRRFRESLAAASRT